jgi:hypothetical protein
LISNVIQLTQQANAEKQIVDVNIAQVDGRAIGPFCTPVPVEITKIKDAVKFFSIRSCVWVAIG